MKFREYLEKLFELKEFLGKDIENFNAVVLFDPDEKPLIKDWRNENNMPVPVKGDGVGNKSGLYFFLSSNGTVLYIGKATKNNVHERIWGHIQTPGGGDTDGIMTFPNNRFKKEFNNKWSSLFESGDVKIGIVEITPEHATSLSEVYLQTISLPPLCKRIG